MNTKSNNTAAVSGEAIAAMKAVVRKVVLDNGLRNGAFIMLSDGVHVMLYDMPATQMSMMTAASQIEQHTPLSVEVRHSSQFSAADQGEFRRIGTAF